MASLFEELKRRNVIRVALVYVFASWLLVQVADIMFESFGTPEWVMKTFIGFLALGFPIAVIFAWAFEITPEGLKKEKDVDRSQSITSQTGRKLDYAIIAVLVVALGYFMFTHEWGAEDGTSAADDKSVAVLPFVSMSSDPENEFFSDGLSETLLHMLAQVQGLRVAARTSSFAFKGDNRDVREIGEELGVATVLEGSVQKAGEQLRITAQLVKTDDGSHLWSQNFDRTREDVFAIQDEIAVEVVKALQGALFGEEQTEHLTRRRTDNVEAWQAYVLGVQELPKRSIPALESARKQFERAIELDPQFAAAYVGLYDTIGLLNEYGSLPIEDVDKSEWLLDTALLLDPDLGEAYASLGLRFNNRERPMHLAELAFKRAIELAPSYASAYQWYGIILRDNTDRFDEILALHRKAKELDPLSQVINVNVAFSLAAAGRTEEALNEYRGVIERFPDYGFGYWGRGWTHYLQTGDLIEAVRNQRTYLEKDPGGIRYGSTLCAIYLDLRDAEAAQGCVDSLRERAPDHWALDNLDLLLAVYRGETVASRELTSTERTGATGAAAIAQPEYLRRDWESARRIMQENWPDLFESELPQVLPTSLLVSIRAALVLMNTGEEERGRQIAQSVLDIVERNGIFIARVYEDVAAHTILGNREKALGLLSTGPSERGRLLWWYLERDPLFDSLRDAPEFQAVLDELGDDMDSQRAALEAEGLMTVPGA